MLDRTVDSTGAVGIPSAADVGTSFVPVAGTSVVLLEVTLASSACQQPIAGWPSVGSKIADLPA